MSASVTFQKYQTVEFTYTATTTGDPVVIAYMENTIASTSPVTILKGGREFATLGATAGNTVSLWPAQVAALASGTAIHFRIQVAYGSTDTTEAARKITYTTGDAVVAAMPTYGRAVEIDLSAVTTLVATRVNNANEVVVVEVLWEVYTI